MCKFWIITVGFLICETLLAFAFSAIAQIYYREIKGFDWKSIFKGMFERLFLTVSLVHDIPHALTLFSALKLATRLKHTEKNEDENKFNDYYLIGNLASVIVAIFYMYVFNEFDNIAFLRKICS